MVLIKWQQYNLTDVKINPPSKPSCPLPPVAFVPSVAFVSQQKQSGTRSLLFVSVLLFCQSLAFADSKQVPLTALLKRQIEATATALNNSGIRSFQNGQLKNDDLVDFGVTTAMLDYHPRIFPINSHGVQASKGFVPAKYVAAEVEKCFGRTVSHSSTKRYHYENGSYAVELSDPDSPPGGLKLGKLIQTGAASYTARVNLYAPDTNDHLSVYATERIDLREVASGAKPHFVVVGYRLQDR